MFIHGIASKSRRFIHGKLSGQTNPLTEPTFDPNTVTNITAGTASTSNEHSVIAGGATTENSIIYVGGIA